MRIFGRSDTIAFAQDKLPTIDIPLIVYNLSCKNLALSERPLLPEQAYELRQYPCGQYELFGDEVGCMYGLLDVAFAMQHQQSWPVGVHVPYLQRRGIKLNVPLDARTPSYSDAGDSAWKNIPYMWDINFWHEYLDQLAMDKYNYISLWSLNPFPSMVIAEGFENASLNDVMRTPQPVTGASLIGFGMYAQEAAESLQLVKSITIEQKILFWQEVMRYGATRGIRFVIMVWNIYPCSASQSEYCISDRMDDPTTIAYYRACAKSMVKTYPLLAGIGVTAGERMGNYRDPFWNTTNDAQWIADTYGRGIQEALNEHPHDFRLIFRQHMCSTRDIENVLKPLGIPVEFSYKYSMAHMYSSTLPTFGNEYFASLSKDAISWLTLRNDDMYMLQWGGYTFSKAYLAGVKREHVCGFMLGSDGYTEAVDFLSKENEGRSTYHRQWLRNALWGRLAYEFQVPRNVFINLLQEKTAMPYRDCQALLEAADLLGNVLPIMGQVHWHNLDFMSYPEACCGLNYAHDTLHYGKNIEYHDIFDFLIAKAQKDSSYLSVQETCALEWRNEPIPKDKLTADEAAIRIEKLVWQSREKLQVTAHLQGVGQSLWDDLNATALLGEFYSLKLKCALHVRRVADGISTGNPIKAIELASCAYECYVQYAQWMTERFYSQRLSRMNGRVVDLYQLQQQALADYQNICSMMKAYIPLSKEKRNE